MKSIPKQYLILGTVVLILVIIVFFVVSGSKSQQAADKDTVFEKPGEIIPTVDSSVKATIKGATDALIVIKGIPDGTTEIEYELSYSTAKGGIEGVFGSIDVDGKSSAEEEIKFGTCSSGVCRYHDIDGPVKGTFKFTGSYGQKLLEQEFDV